ncbi:class I SAM-dependent methyltransferase [Nonlabens ponticola]|uniref:Class I SAM-dependent methyltransferase n=1 Tax=Nonlabens ponticola TaxID=2496866 RepID=A0A3S9MVC9_9FLAO|nr:class I SAM-dependent methyltransferase [Nonlabens ponticola]AZQ43138.1 class I SAM-dependent methyltransferase [Nonlabens ponticola]
MSKKKKLHSSTQDYFLTQEHFDIVKTTIDGLLKTMPIPSNLDKYYQSDEYLSHDDSNTGLFASLYKTARNWNLNSKKSLISKYLPEGPMLDIGAGNGELVSYLRENRFDAIGFEPSPLARKFAYQKGIQLLDELPDAQIKSYRVVTMFHVLEHVEDLSEQLHYLSKIVEEDGHVIIAVPNHKSLDAKLFGKYWAAWDVPRHLWHFDKNGIQSVFDGKFELVNTKVMWLDSFYVSILSARYKKWPLPLVIGGIIGLFSNIATIFTNQASSHIYIFKKAQ